MLPLLSGQEKLNARKNIASYFMRFCFIVLLIFIAGMGCKKNEHPFPFLLDSYEQVNLVSDTMGYGAAIIDPNLVNAWGIAEAPSGPIWISANGTGVSPIYNKSGVTLRSPVTIPSAVADAGGGTPSGIVFNGTTNFVIPGTTTVSHFIFSSEDGIISAWGGGNAAVKVADRSAWGTVYKGLAMAWNGANFLYATNFRGRMIDVFDSNFNYVSSKGFQDPFIPNDFGPFNIRNIGGKLYVTYAKLKAPDDMDDQAGPGNGFVDVFWPNGDFIKRFATRGVLNSPWGIAQVPASFAKIDNAILIGNFGDGRINIFAGDGAFLGQLQKNGKPLKIDGLWALESNVPATDSTQVYFTAGPADESHGLFGYLMHK
jgi:uncharacterized protein (TIGR03118 family)